MSKKKETIFIIIGILLLLVTVGLVVYSINFLLGNIGSAVDQNSLEDRKVVRFNLDGLKELGIIK